MKKVSLIIYCSSMVNFKITKVICTKGAMVYDKHRDQTARLFFQYSALFNNEHLPKVLKNCQISFFILPNTNLTFIKLPKAI